MTKVDQAYINGMTAVRAALDDLERGYFLDRYDSYKVQQQKQLIISAIRNNIKPRIDALIDIKKDEFETKRTTKKD